MKYWEISLTISGKRMEFGLGLSHRFARRTIWLVDAHRDGKRFIVRADEILTAFMELKRRFTRSR